MSVLLSDKYPQKTRSPRAALTLAPPRIQNEPLVPRKPLVYSAPQIQGLPRIEWCINTTVTKHLLFELFQESELSVARSVLARFNRQVGSAQRRRGRKKGRARERAHFSDVGVDEDNDEVMQVIDHRMIRMAIFPAHREKKG